VLSTCGVDDTLARSLAEERRAIATVYVCVVDATRQRRGRGCGWRSTSIQSVYDLSPRTRPRLWDVLIVMIKTGGSVEVLEMKRFDCHSIAWKFAHELLCFVSKPELDNVNKLTSAVNNTIFSPTSVHIGARDKDIPYTPPPLSRHVRLLSPGGDSESHLHPQTVDSRQSRLSHMAINLILPSLHHPE